MWSTFARRWECLVVGVCASKVCTANGDLHLSSDFALLGFPRSCTRLLWFVVFPLRPMGCTPAEALLRLSAAVAAAYGRVPRGQWALLDAAMFELIDRSECLVDAVVVVSRARASRTEHVQRRVGSLLVNIPSARPCGRSCAPRAAHPELLLSLLSQIGDYSCSLTILCTLSPWCIGSSDWLLTELSCGNCDVFAHPSR